MNRQIDIIPLCKTSAQREGQQESRRRRGSAEGWLDWPGGGGGTGGKGGLVLIYICTRNFFFFSLFFSPFFFPLFFTWTNMVTFCCLFAGIQVFPSRTGVFGLNWQVSWIYLDDKHTNETMIYNRSVNLKKIWNTKK